MSDELRVLSEYPPDLHPLQIQFLASAGGMSGAQFWRITTACGPFILRRWPAESPAAERLRYIHAVLQHAAGHGAAVVPLPATTSRAESFISHAGYLWQLEPWLPGRADYQDAPSVEKSAAAMQALATFHNAVANFRAPSSCGTATGSNAVRRHFSRLRKLQQENDLGKHSIDNNLLPELAPLAREFLARLPQLIPLAIAQLEPLVDAELPVQPCIRDIWRDHILFTGNRVTGIIDFGALDVDTPATDIARLLNSLSETPFPNREGQGEGSRLLVSDETWQLALRAYQQTRPLSADELRAAHALGISGNILAGCNWIRWLYIEQRQFENPAQITERFRHIVARGIELMNKPELAS
jgi:homoserine kinase type II